MTTIIYFDTQIIPVLASGSSFKQLLILQIFVHLNLRTSLTFSTRCSRFILHFLYPNPIISHLSKNPWDLIAMNGIQNSKFVYLVYTLYYCIDTYSMPSQWTELYTFIIFTFISTFICTPMFTSIITSIYLIYVITSSVYLFWQGALIIFSIL